MDCSDDQCAIGCADSQFMERQNTSYFPVDVVDKLADRRIDFSRCHDVWHLASVNLLDTTGGNSFFYVVTGIVAALLNVAILIRGVCKIWNWSKQTGKIWATGPDTTAGLEVKTHERTFWKNDSTKDKLMSWKSLIFSIMATLLTQVADSLLDALYFVKLKTEPRLIHVPPSIVAFQGVLLFTCKCLLYRLSQ